MKFLKQSMGVTIAAGFLLFFYASYAEAQNLQDFVINDFTQEYSLTSTNKVSSATVSDYITATFPMVNQNHGIIRAIPESYNGTSLHVSNITVYATTYGATQQGKSVPFSTTSDNGNKVIKIGDSNTYVNGTQYYQVNYSLQNVIRTYDDHDELYINVNGTQWQQSIQSVSSVIIMPSSLGTLVSKQVCFTGQQGSTSTLCKTNVSDNGTNTEFRTNAEQSFSTGENLSVALWFPKNTFIVVGPTFIEKFGPFIFAGAIACIPVITFIILLRKWLKYGRDPKGKGTVVAQYQPYPGLDILHSGVILKQTSTPKAISAQIIDLAIRGYIRIIDESEIKNDKPKKAVYQLEKIKEPTDLPTDQATIMDTIFKSGNLVKLNDLSSKLYSTSTKIGKSVEDNLVKEGYYKAAPSKVRQKYISIGIVFIVVGIFTSVLFVGIGLIVSGILCVLFGLIMPARTLEGVDANEYLLGLKEYISMAERDRLAFHQSEPNAERMRVALNDSRQKIHLYESLLPYAMLFDLEKSWSKQFAALYTQPPTWYSGSTAFSAIYFANTVGSFTASSSAAFSSPSSSGGTGFSGGGFSGGGGGGGGGGGW